MDFCICMKVFVARDGVAMLRNAYGRRGNIVSINMLMDGLSFRYTETRKA